MNTKRFFFLAIHLSVLLASVVVAQVNHAIVQPKAQDDLQASRIVAVPLQRVEPFLALGAQWQAASDEPLQIRTSVDGLTWSDWQTLSHDHDGARGKHTSGLILLNAVTRFIEYRIGKTRDLRLHFISPGATSSESLNTIQQRTQNVMSQTQPKYPKPPVVTRTEWGCPDGQTTSRPPLSYTTVTHLIVHHSATGNTATNNDWPAVVRSIWNFHMFTNGWSDIGYNYLVDPNGVIYEGRSGGDNVLGAHFSGVNGGTMGVCMIGTYTDATPNEKALNSLRRILAWKADQRGIDVAGKSRHAASGLDLNNLSGHRDGPGATECPGNALYPLLATLRTGVKELMVPASPLASVSAASYTGDTIAPESIVAAFGNELAASAQAGATSPLPVNLNGTTMTIRDSANKEVFAPLFFVSPAQINYYVPAGLASGPATVVVTNSAGKLASGVVTLAPVSPALFAANANGRGVAAAVVLRVKADGSQSYEAATQWDAAQNQFVPLPIDLGAESDLVFLIAFGTGLRNHSGLNAIAASIGGTDAPVLYVGKSGDLVGLDQVNLRLPRTLLGRGEVEFALTADGKTANPLRIAIK
ncbi:MAG: hypothetical protein HOP19_19980 [Acidobacteria bacterium]|nr:hypothetical protein [Acidobacteriota bacterium]